MNARFGTPPSGDTRTPGIVSVGCAGIGSSAKPSPTSDRTNGMPA
jgi:hypothetical protein